MTKKSSKQSKSKNKKSFWLTHWPAALILFLLPFALYFATFKFGYVLDDAIVVSENDFVKEGVSGIKDILSYDTFTGYLGKQQTLVAGARYRPLSLVTFAVEHELYGLNPGRSHFINVLLYSLTGLLIFRLFFMLFKPKKGSPWYLGFSFLVALLFLLHPIHTEVVANIKGRDEILVLLLSLATLYYALQAHLKDNILYLFVSSFVFLLALLAKENAVTFLAIIPAALFFFAKAEIKQLIPGVVSLLAAFALYIAFRISAIGFLFAPDFEAISIMNDPFLNTTFVEKHATIMYTLGEYLKLLILPINLTHDYYPFQVPILTFSDYRVWIAMLANGALVFWMFRSWKRGSIPAWTILFYFASLSIVSNIVFSVGAPMNERFVYVSSLGFIALLVWLLTIWLPKQKAMKDVAPIIGIMVLGLCILGYSAKTITRVPAWKDAMSLNRAAIKVSKNSARAHQYMGYSLYQLGQKQSGQEQLATYQEALPLVSRALEIYPGYLDALRCKSGLMAGIYQQTGDLDVLLNWFTEVLSIGHFEFLDKYMVYLNKRADANRLADFYYRVGYEVLGQQRKQYELARRYINFGLEIAPNDPRLVQAAQALQ